MNSSIWDPLLDLRFRPFALWIWSFDFHNLFIHMVDPVRFERERQEARKAAWENQGEPEVDMSSYWESVKRVFKERGWKMIFPIVNALIILTDCIKCGFFTGIIDLTRVVELDGQVKRRVYKNLLLRRMEFLAINDHTESFEQGQHLSRLVMVIYISHLLIKMQAFNLYIDSERVNYARYRRINFVQSMVTYMGCANASIREIWSLVKIALVHECELSDGRHRNKIVWQMRRLNESVRDWPRLDRYYYFNQLNFTHCHEGLNIFDFPSSKTRNLGAKVIQPGEPRDKPRRVLASESFLPRPYHRADIREEGIVIVISFLGVVALFGTPFINFGVYFHQNMIKFLWPEQNPSIMQTIVVFLTNWRATVTGVHLLILAQLWAFNVAHVAILIGSTFIYWSRTRRVLAIIQVLQAESSLRAQLVHVQMPIASSRRFNQNSRSYKEPARLNSIGINKVSYEDHLEARPHYPVMEPVDELEEDSPFEAPRQVGPEVATFNAQLEHLADLIGNLIQELNDIRDFFTVFVNIYFVTGTIVVAMNLSSIYRCRSFEEFILLMSMSFIILIPMIFSFLLGALSEYMSRSIARALAFLVAQSFHWIEPEVAAPLLGQYEYLSNIRNRSILVMENVPLTFSSVLSILSWIASASLLIQSKL